MQSIVRRLLPRLIYNVDMYNSFFFFCFCFYYTLFVRRNIKDIVLIAKTKYIVGLFMQNFHIRSLLYLKINNRSKRKGNRKYLLRKTYTWKFDFELKECSKSNRLKLSNSNTLLTQSHFHCRKDSVTEFSHYTTQILSVPCIGIKVKEFSYNSSVE